MKNALYVIAAVIVVAFALAYEITKTFVFLGLIFSFKGVFWTAFVAVIVFAILAFLALRLHRRAK